MAATCSICRHASRATIEEAHIQGASLRAIAKQFAGVSAWAVRRHVQNCLPGIIQKVTAHQEQQHRVSARLPGRVEVLISELERMTANALRRRDYASALRSITARLQALRTIGELSGELRNGPRIGELVPGTAVQVNVSSAPPASETKDPQWLVRRMCEIYGLPWPREHPGSDERKPN
jgi:hypothetical protein